jgi:hypothetical protein
MGLQTPVQNRERATRRARARSVPRGRIDAILVGKCPQCRDGRFGLLFAAEILRHLRGGSAPPARALEWAPFVDHWSIVANDDVCLLTGTAWRLPLSRKALETPLLAIDPVAGWARTVDEWFTIGTPRADFVAAGLYPEQVARRAALWIERQIGGHDRIVNEPAHC